MSVNGRDSNAPTNMLPYIRELESVIQDMKDRITQLEREIK